MNIEEPHVQQDIAPLWRLAFRAGFLGAGLFAVAAMIRWLLWVEAPAGWTAEISPQWWHAHEMIFGFALPVVAGFLLSAVAVWTGIAGTKGLRLQVLFGAWLLARIILWLAPSAVLLAWAAEMLFIALLIYELGSRVWARRQWRNMLFLPVLLGLAVLNTTSYATADDFILSTRLHYSAVWLITIIITIVGGRVTPLFTANRLGLKKRPLPDWLEYSAIGSVALVAGLLAIWPMPLITDQLQVLCLLAFCIHLYRLAHWQGWKTGSVPLLWSMHLSYLCIPLALLGIAIVGDNPVAVKNIMHLLAIGTIGGMILAMMSRVSLGHTGRAMELSGGVATAFALIFIAAIVRAILPIIDPVLTHWSWRISAALWIVAFAVFVFRYYPVLTKPRVDGKPG
ncbi:MAG: NnrS family protein [Proteobacteria bacterium]|nr:NnrS family protein [Pseudomonadota bacterium]